ncbi:adenylate/guanylate cyclase domain-containing protein [soil metagenome]
MSIDPPSTLDLALRAKAIREQAKGELVSCAIFIVASLSIFIVLSFLGEARELHAYDTLRLIFLSGAVFLFALIAIAWRGWWHPAVRFLNTGVQITLLSSFLYVIVREKGTAFALSTAIPMLYCLAISMTAFRLSPSLSLFAGALAGGEFVFIYYFFMLPKLTPALVDANPTLAWPALIARVFVLLATGIACALAARALRNQTEKATEDQTRIQLLERTFGRLVAPDIARRILEDDDWMKPARRDAVVMFADLKGFTAYSDGKNPEDVAEFLNRCWTVAAAAVEKNGGVINKYMGDGFLAIFGVPLELANAEKAAAQTAHELQRDLAPILEKEGLSICVGLHAGPMIVGGIGSEARCEFTVIGSTVNLASRLETLNRALSSNCLTSETVADKLHEHWDMKSRGGHQVKGVSGDVGVFELGGKKKPASET